MRDFLRMISLLLPLAFVAPGCGMVEDINDGDEDCVGAACESATEAEGFSTTVKLTPPYGFVAEDFEISDNNGATWFTCPGPDCNLEVTEPGTYLAKPRGENFVCVKSGFTVAQSGNSANVSLPEWGEEGQCSNAPEGESGGLSVKTDVNDTNGFEQVWLFMGNYRAVATKNTFKADPEDEYIFEGTDYLNEEGKWVISYHLVSGSIDEESTIVLEE